MFDEQRRFADHRVDAVADRANAVYPVVAFGSDDELHETGAAAAGIGAVA